MDHALTIQNQRSEFTFWRRLMVVIVVGGLLLTTIVADLQQQAAERERALMLSAEADRVTGLLADSIETRIDNFASAVNFVAATHPGPLDQYQHFMVANSELTAPGDPGIMVFEAVSADGIEALREREAALGNYEFELTLFGSHPGERFILTRLVEDPGFSGLRLLGIDATSARELVIPETLVADGAETGEPRLFVADSAAALRLLPTGPAAPTGLPNHVVFLVAKVPGTATVGSYVVAGIGATEMIGAEELTATTNLRMTLSIGEIDGAVFSSSGQSDTSDTQSDLTLQRTIETAGLTWRFQLTAPPGFGPPTGIFDQSSVWVGGLALIAIALVFASRRHTVRQRLNSAHFELENALTLASTDALTGLLNRKGLVDAARDCDHRRPAALFFLDLDGFKAVNDIKGHEQGDEVLRRVSVELRNIFRSEDLISRLGGDEFVVFVEGSPYEDFTVAVSQRIIEAISTIDANVTCSVGVSTRPANSTIDIKEMLRQADAAMYSAKRSGGDRFEINAFEAADRYMPAPPWRAGQQNS